ncbi:MAG: LysR family transcriptional regulator [Gemmatimonadota bacterium]
MATDLVAAMRVFTAVVEAGSFAGAADKLELSRGMATRYVAQLEAHLGVRLLNRTTRRLSLTQAGGDHYQRATQIIGLVEDAERSAAQEAAIPRGTLRVTTPAVFGIHHLDRAVAAYVQRYPGVEVDVSISERMVDLVDEGFDLAVRVTRDIAPGLIARRLSRARLAACAAPAYLKKHGVPGAPEDLARHNCLFYSHSSYRNEWRFRREGEERTVRVSGNLRSNIGDVLMNAAINGLGVIYEPTFLVHEALRQKRLIRILPDWEPDEFSLFAVYPNRKFLPPKVRSFIDFLAERFGPEPYWDLDDKGSAAGSRADESRRAVASAHEARRTRRRTRR